MKQTFRALLLTATAMFSLPAYAAEEEKPVAPAAAPAVVLEKPVAPVAVVAEKLADNSKDFTIIKMGAEEIKNSDVISTWKGLFPGGAAPDFNGFDENVRQNVLRGLVSEKLIYAEAVKAGVDKDPEVKKRIATVEKQVIMQNFMESKAKTLVTDDQLRAVYNTKLAAAKGQEELKARHILVASEDEAKKLSAQIKKGGDFEKIAKEKSTDKGSGANGGELGWFTKEKMVPEFADAAYKLKKGEVSEPVKSEFGWHVIKLDDRRQLQIASFDEMKEMMKSELANKAVQGYVEGLLKGANVKYFGADGKEKPLALTLLPPKAEDKPAAAQEEKK
jgi:peptidyl-prolyl cis-trans isomerase C